MQVPTEIHNNMQLRKSLFSNILVISNSRVGCNQTTSILYLI